MRSVTTADRERVIAWEMARLGDHERPLGSNRTDYGAFMGTNGQPWCAAFQSMAHFETLGFSPFPATSAKGSASCYAIEQYARRKSMFVSARDIARRGDLVLFRWSGDSIVHHIALVLEAHGVGDVDTVAGNESDRVRLTRRRSSIAGYVRIPYVAVNTAPATNPNKPVDLGTPPVLRHTLRVHGKQNDPVAVRYLQRGLNAVLPFWGKSFHVAPSGVFDTETLLGLQAFKHGANQKQWQANAGRVADRFFRDEKDGLAGPRTMQYLRFFAMIGPTQK